MYELYTNGKLYLYILNVAVDSELGVDIQDGVLDSSTDIELEHGNDGTMTGSSVQDVSCLEQSDKMTNDSSREVVTVVEGDEPYVGQEFESEEAAHAFYSAYGSRVGFITRINYLSRSKLDGTVIGRTLVCNKEGYRKPYRCDKKNMKPRTPTRVGCKAMLSIRKLSTGKWVVTKFVKEHTHAFAAGNTQNGLTTNQIPVSLLSSSFSSCVCCEIISSLLYALLLNMI